MTRKVRTIGPWGNPARGPRHTRPESWAALEAFGRELEAAEGETPLAVWMNSLLLKQPAAPSTVAVMASDLHALGRALRRIAAGEDARHVFGQAKVGHRQDATPQQQRLALIYYRTLAQQLEAGEVNERAAKKAAIGAARKLAPDVDEATVPRYAQKHRDAVWPLLEATAKSGQGPKLKALKAYLAKHSRQGRMPD